MLARLACKGLSLRNLMGPASAAVVSDRSTVELAEPYKASIAQNSLFLRIEKDPYGQHHLSPPTDVMSREATSPTQVHLEQFSKKTSIRLAFFAVGPNA